LADAERRAVRGHDLFYELIYPRGAMASFPTAVKQPKEITQHGQSRVDNYFWMSYKEDPEEMKYLHTEQD
jgi:hypothetical protein